MVVLWQTSIPCHIYAGLYCSWKRVVREVEVLKNIFYRYNARRLIEFGCGLGRHGYLLSKAGFNVVLTDAKDWRYGVAKKLPFIKLDVLDENLNVGSEFDGGYAINFLTIFKYDDMIKALRNIGKIIGNGVFIADYNFTLYSEPREVRVRVKGKTYRALLDEERVEPIEGGVFYKYRVKILDSRGKVVGVEEDAYPVYEREFVFNAIKDAGFKVLEVLWARWDPVNYLYELVNGESDSAFIVMTKER